MTLRKLKLSRLTTIAFYRSQIVRIRTFSFLKGSALAQIRTHSGTCDLKYRVRNSKKMNSSNSRKRRIPIIKEPRMELSWLKFELKVVALIRHSSKDRLLDKQSMSVSLLQMRAKPSYLKGSKKSSLVVVLV